MNADAFRHFFEYHFAENRLVWAACERLSDEQFTREASYSHGSVRDQVVHLLSVDDAWFGDLRQAAPTDGFPAVSNDRAAMRIHWDAVEQRMREYLSTLRDDMLFEKPFTEGEDRDLILWQVLLHVGNHGTDHRAQVLRLLNDLGVKTVSQDYVFFAYDNPVAGVGRG